MDRRAASVGPLSLPDTAHMPAALGVFLATLEIMQARRGRPLPDEHPLGARRGPTQAREHPEAALARGALASSAKALESALCAARVLPRTTKPDVSRSSRCGA